MNVPFKDQKETIKEEFFSNLGEESLEEVQEGQLAVDVYQTKNAVIVKAPLAGVKSEDIDITVTDDVVTIKGQRKEQREEALEHYFVQECYWGEFSRSIILPVPVVAEKTEASLKEGILTVTLPKVESMKLRKIKVKAE